MELQTLPYDYNELEPSIDEQTMHIHHDKHHAGYLDKYEKAITGTELEGKDILEVLKDLNSIPVEIKTAIVNNGGGVVNHNFFFDSLSPDGGIPTGALQQALIAKYGSVEAFKEAFSAAAGKVFGSGWCWLVKEDLEIVQTSGHDTPVSQGKTPLLVIDVWEHAYYLKYQNKRPEYISAFWDVVNWKKVEERF